MAKLKLKSIIQKTQAPFTRKASFGVKQNIGSDETPRGIKLLEDQELK